MFCRRLVNQRLHSFRDLKFLNNHKTPFNFQKTSKSFNRRFIPFTSVVNTRSFASPSSPTTTTTTTTREQETKNEQGVLKWLRRFGWHPDQLVVKDNSKVNRWRFVPVAIINHMCLGGIFAWSIFNDPITRLHGVLVPAAADWSLAQTSITFSLVMGGFVWGAVVGNYLDRWGPRFSCSLGALSLGGGFGLASLGLSTHNLFLLYAGGAVWGLSLAWSYVPPVSTLMKWFPDRKGVASGGCILGFGAGSAIGAPLFASLLKYFRVAPERVGSVDEVSMVNQNGSLFVKQLENGVETLREVVVATANDVKTWSVDEGVYLVDTGSTGMSQTFVVLAVGYMATMLTTSMMYRFPAPGYQPPSHSKPVVTANPTTPPPPKAQLTTFNVDATVATKSPQFWIAYTGFGLSICGAYGILAMGKTMLADSFGTMMPEVVTGAFLATFVSAMGFSNLAGRISWSALSDVLARRYKDPFYGRKLTFSLMWGIGPPLYMLVVWSVHACANGNHTLLPLAAFTLGVCGVLSGFGGTAAARPALAGDLFGTKHVGVLTARQLSVVMPAAFIGPKVASYFREQSLHKSARELASLIDDDKFKAAFSAPKDQIEQLLQAKTVTIARLMDLVPEGTVDPTPFVYDNTMYVMAGLQGMAFLTNQLLKPVPKRFHEKETKENLIEKKEKNEEEGEEKVEIK